MVDGQPECETEPAGTDPKALGHEWGLTVLLAGAAGWCTCYRCCCYSATIAYAGCGGIENGCLNVDMYGMYV